MLKSMVIRSVSTRMLVYKKDVHWKRETFFALYSPTVFDYIVYIL